MELFDHYIDKLHRYEEDEVQAMAISVIPLDDLSIAASETVALGLAFDHPIGEGDALMSELLCWFKKDFFKWMDNPACHNCGGPTKSLYQGVAQPTHEELRFKASRVELFKCNPCNVITRFPRYNDPIKLLETRTGRCGEWANTFALCCRTLGYKIRLVIDMKDHVWVEYWSEASERWVHIDPGEGILDKPLLYEKGWGKQVDHVYALGIDGVREVTRRYSARGHQAQGDSHTLSYLNVLTESLRSGLSEEEVKELTRMDAMEHEELKTGHSKHACTQSLPGRSTGQADWIATRGEGGVMRSEKVVGTRYRWARDLDVVQSMPHRLVGGAARASGENAPEEMAEKAFDGQVHTKWLDFTGRTAWLEYRLPITQENISVQRYSIVSADDSPERDPCSWSVEASTDEGTWVEIDRRQGISFRGRHLEMVFTTAQEVPSKRWRLTVLELNNEKAANSVQISCFNLFIT